VKYRDNFSFFALPKHISAKAAQAGGQFDLDGYNEMVPDVCVGNLWKTGASRIKPPLASTTEMHIYIYIYIYICRRFSV
jgi:hypothetical protein